MRHAHGYFEAQASCNHTDGIAEKDIGQRSKLLVFFSILAVHEVHLQSDRRHIAPSVVFSLRRISHILITGGQALVVISFGHFLGSGYRKVNPLRMRESTDVWTIDIQFREIQNIAISVFAGRHDARNSIGHIHIDGNTRKVFLLTDLNLAVCANTADKEHIEPVTCQFCTVLRDQAVLTQESLHRVDVLKRDIRSCALQIGVEREIVLR